MDKPEREHDKAVTVSENSQASAARKTQWAQKHNFSTLLPTIPLRKGMGIEWHKASTRVERRRTLDIDMMGLQSSSPDALQSIDMTHY